MRWWHFVHGFQQNYLLDFPVEWMCCNCEKINASKAAQQVKKLKWTITKSHRKVVNILDFCALLGIQVQKDAVMEIIFKFLAKSMQGKFTLHFIIVLNTITIGIIGEQTTTTSLSFQDSTIMMLYYLKEAMSFCMLG